MASKYVFFMIFLLLNLLCFRTENMVSLENVLCELEKNVRPTSSGWSVLEVTEPVGWY
jgi:hypothetical protein